MNCVFVSPLLLLLCALQFSLSKNFDYELHDLVFQERPRDIETVIGRTHTIDITCRTYTSGYSHRFILWTLNDNELSGEQYSIRANGDLRISNFGVEDSGNYTCHVRNEIDSISASAYLAVRRRTILEAADPFYEASPHDSIDIICVISEKDDALQTFIDWKYNDEIINASHPRISIVNSKSNNSTIVSKLTNSDVSWSDAGNYSCTARTKLDEDTNYFQLRVTDRPDGPLVIDVECRPTEAKIRWTTSSDNGEPILNYIVQYESSIKPGIWITVADNVSSVDRDYLVPLRPGAKHHFHIFARNIKGLSDPYHRLLYEHPGALPECTAEEAAPKKNPENVMVKVLKDPASVVISWTPLPEDDHQGPHLYYEVWYKPNSPNGHWEKRTVQDWRQGEYVANVSSTSDDYIAMVIAGNVKGRAASPAQKVIGYSLERETWLLTALDNTSNVQNVTDGNPVERSIIPYSSISHSISSTSPTGLNLLGDLPNLTNTSDGKLSDMSDLLRNSDQVHVSQ